MGGCIVLANGGGRRYALGSPCSTVGYPCARTMHEKTQKQIQGLCHIPRGTRAMRSLVFGQFIENRATDPMTNSKHAC